MVHQYHPDSLIVPIKLLIVSIGVIALKSYSIINDSLDNLLTNALISSCSKSLSVDKQTIPNFINPDPPSRYPLVARRAARQHRQRFIVHHKKKKAVHTDS
jgi:hypothetical protein